MSGRSSWFQRYLLPGLALKAFIIGGGYATGRELAEFFMPAGPQGGLMGMLMAMVIWSAVAVVTFLFARATDSYDYRSFFKQLLGPGWLLFEITYVLFIVLILAVFGGVAGAIGKATFGWPEIVGTLGLMGSVALIVAFGATSVERLFKYAAFFLYGVYALFLVFSLGTFGDRIALNLSTPAPTDGWLAGGLTYAGYNIIGAVVILPIIRHLTSRRDAVVAGLVAGPLAMIPAIIFFVCMTAYYPEIAKEALPSDFLLDRLRLPAFQVAFQLMIFIALLETCVGAIHAINERVSNVYEHRRGRALSVRVRLAIAAVLLIGSIFVAQRFGFVELIAKGYRFIAWVFLAVYILPLLTWGVWRLWKGRDPGPAPA